LEGIEIKQLDSSRIAMIAAKIPKAQFASYRLGSPEDIGIDLGRISRLTGDMPDDEELTITLQEENGKKRLKLECGGHHNSVLTESGISAVEKIPIMPFKSVVEIDGKLLQKSVYEIDKASGIKRGRGYITFRITKENFILRTAVGDEEEISRIFDKTQVKLKADAQEQRAVYNSEHIEGMLKILKKNVLVTIQLTTNEPIGISYHMDGVEFAYYLAPYMENE
jgi:DNA polymerase III sliding clamp (beta) subunit (PCNA family)